MTSRARGDAAPPALASSVYVLACPHCRGPLALAERSLVCARGHGFDIARQGYVNLLTGRGPGDTADTPAMVVARERFLDRGHYAPVTQAIVEAARGAALQITPEAGHILDVGAGPGHHLAAVVEALPGWRGLALDLSKHAMRRAARRGVAAAVCDTWKALPVRDATVGLVLAIFAPRNVAEIARVLKPEGRFVLVTPTPAHLAELVEPLGLVTVDPAKPERLAAQIAGALRLEERSRVSYTMTLAHDDAEALVLMGPSARHVSPEAVRALLAGCVEPVPVRCEVDVAVYRAPPVSG